MQTFTFTDTEGRSWDVPKITGRHVLGLNNKHGLQIDDGIKEGHFWSENDAALIYCGTLLFYLCGEQHSIDEVEFFHGFDGEVFAKAQGALAERIINFTPPGRREKLREYRHLMGKQRELMMVTSAEEIQVLASRLQFLENLEVNGIDLEEATAQLFPNCSNEPAKRG